VRWEHLPYFRKFFPTPPGKSSFSRRENFSHRTEASRYRRLFRKSTWIPSVGIGEPTFYCPAFRIAFETGFLRA
jgi:hypothetical protein